MDTNEAQAQTDLVMAEDQVDTLDDTQDNNLGGNNDDFLAYEQAIEALRLGENQDEGDELDGGQEGITSEEVQEEVNDATEEVESEETPKPEEDAGAEADDEDDAEDDTETATKKPSRYRLGELSDIDHRAMELKKRNADLSLAECVEIATQEIAPESEEEQEAEPTESESSQIKSQITELRSKYDAFMDDYDVDDAKAVLGEIEELRDQLQEVLVAEGIERVESRLEARRSEESYEQSLQSSFDEASKAFPDFADPKSPLSILAAKIAKANSFDDPQYNDSPNKPFLAAKEAADMLGLIASKSTSKPAQAETRPSFPARGGAKTVTQPTTPNNIEEMIDNVSSTDEFEALMEKITA